MQLPRRTMGRVAVGVTAAATATHQPILLLVAPGALLLMLIAGVVLPAVWSTKPTRRQAAAAVLDQLLTTITRRASNTAVDYGRAQSVKPTLLPKQQHRQTPPDRAPTRPRSRASVASRQATPRRGV